MYPVIKIENGVPRHPLYRMAEPVNFTLNKDETITKKTTVDGELTVGKTKFVPIDGHEIRAARAMGISMGDKRK